MGTSSSKAIVEPTKPHPDVDQIVDWFPSSGFSGSGVPYFTVHSTSDEKDVYTLNDVGTTHVITMTIDNDKDDLSENITFFCYAHRQQAPAENVKMTEISTLFGEGPMALHKKALVPSNSVHLVFRKRLIRISFGKQMQLSVVPANITTATQMSQRKEAHQFLLNFMAVVVEYYNIHDRSNNDVRVYTNDGSDWERNNRLTPRPLQTVCLPAGQKEAVLADIETFRANVSKLQQLGLPAKRGYLLSGLPGTGKTSLVTALSAHFKYKICVLSLAEKGLSDSTLPKLIQDMPENSALIIEDIDRMASAVAYAGASEDWPALEPSRKKAKTSAKQAPVSVGVSMSCLLSVLDGVLSNSGGQIVFFTTNHPEVLDDALLRPGRVDYHLKLGYADLSQLKAITSIFWPAQPEIVEKMATFFQPQLTPATIMSRLATLMNRPAQELLALKELVW